MIGYILAALFTINPAVDEATRHHDIDLTFTFGAIALALVIGVLIFDEIHDKKKHKEIIDAVNDRLNDYVNAEAASEASVPSRVAAEAHDASPPISDDTTATIAPAPSGPRIIHFKDLAAEVGTRAELTMRVTRYPAKVFESLPKPAGLRQQAFDLVKAVRECLIKYHGSLDADSFVDPEISTVFTTRLLAVKNKIQNFQHRDILRHDSKFPVTVKRMAMFLDDLERAAADLKEDIPPIQQE